MSRYVDIYKPARINVDLDIKKKKLCLFLNFWFNCCSVLKFFAMLVNQKYTILMGTFLGLDLINMKLQLSNVGKACI